MRKDKSVAENAVSLAMAKRAGRKPSEDVTIERLTDLLVFSTAAMLFENVSDGEDASEAHLAAGEKLFRRYYDVQQSGVERYILPLVELPNFTRFKPAVERALRTQDRSNYRHFVSNVMPLISHLTLQPVKFREVFTGRSAKVMRTLVSEVWGNDDLDLLDPKSLAPFPKIPSVSAAPALRAWSKQAAVLSGISLASEDVDVAVADAETASNIGDEINKIDHKIGAADPMTQESADLQLERIDLQSSLQDAVEGSQNPALSLATAVQALKADAVPDYLRNLDDEKIAYIYAEGKTLLNAGAGSGKTLGVTCRIKYLIEEKGIHPDQIIACSFTKAASAEIADRLKTKFGIEGKYIGRTSNSLAYNIVTQYRPDLAAALRNGSKADALMRYAFKQLTLKGTESYVSNRANSPYATRAIAVDNPSLSWIHMGKEPVDSEGKPIRFRQLTLTISKWKNDLYKPEDARQMPNPSPYHRAATAMYAAYEWLKRYEPTMSPCLDFDDQHVVAYETLRDNSQIRERIQGQFRVVIIDEGQDYNKLQMKLFGLISGKAEYVDYVGDDRQCQNVDTIVQTEAGPKRSDELVVGDSILAYRNGSVMMQKVAHIQGTDWDYGYEFVTESGKHLHITPNHKIWADTDMVLTGEDHVVYLMYRPGYGFRVGVSRNQPNIYGRAGQEGASHMWILHHTPSLAEALFLEESVSLTYGIPTIVYNGKKRGLDQARIEKIFQNFGSNGYKVLKDFHLSFEMPNWMAASYSKHGRTTRTIYLKGHTSQSTHVLLEWSGSDLDAQINPEWVTDARIGKRIRKYFASYQEGLLFANQLKEMTGANVAHQLSVPEGLLKKIPASSLFVGMKVPVLDDEGRVVLENIISKTKKSGTFISIQVDDASNFFGNGILSSNSIYGFRGAAPEEFVNLRDIGDFKVLNMQTNYRSGSAIVNAGEQLIAYNTDQLPKTCRAEVSRGDGLIRYEEPETHQEAATRIATEIQDGILNGGADPSAFGVVVRNNAEKDAVMLSLIARGIPYRSNSDTDYFNNPAVRSMLAWVGVATMIDPSEVKDRTEALKSALKFPSFPDFKLPYRYIENLEGKYRSADLVGDVMRDRTKDAGVQQLQKSIDSLERLALQEDTGLLISSILNLQGQTGSMLSVLAEGVDVDKMIEEGLNPDEITKEMMEERVLATFEPIRDLAAVRPTPRAFLDVLRKLKAANVKCKKGAKSSGNIEPAVQIDTCHQWKGLEAESVFVIMAKGVWPSSRNENEKAIAEERRLAYVAITRGRDRVKVMCPQTAYNGKVGGGPSQFVHEACIHPEDSMNVKKAGKKVRKSARRSMYEIASLIDQPDFLGEVL